MCTWVRTDAMVSVRGGGVCGYIRVYATESGLQEGTGVRVRCVRQMWGGADTEDVLGETACRDEEVLLSRGLRLV